MKALPHVQKLLRKKVMSKLACFYSANFFCNFIVNGNTAIVSCAENPDFRVWIQCFALSRIIWEDKLAAQG